MSTQMNFKKRGKLDFWIIAVTSLASLVCLNVIASNFFFRVDLTRAGLYTLSATTEKVLGELEDPIHVTGYFTRNLPSPFATTARDVADVLEEYRVKSNNKVSFEIIDPETLLSDDDRAKKKEVKRDIFGQVRRQETEVSRNLTQLGVQPVEVRVIENDQQIQKPGYMGVVIHYQDKTESIPVVRSAERLEYDLTTQIRNLTRVRTPVLGLLQGAGELSLEEDLARLAAAFSESYDVRGVELKGKSREDADKALADVDALLVIGTKEPYGEDAVAAIDAFLMRGRGAAFLLDNYSIDLKTFAPTPVEHGFTDLLNTYGIGLSEELVADAECASFPISERQGGRMMRKNIKYPFFPVAKDFAQEHPVTKGLSGFALPWASPLLPSAPTGVTVTTLVKSSEMSWTEAGTPEQLDPRRDFGETEIKTTGPHSLIASLSGSLPSAFGEGKKSAKESRIVVVGSSGLASKNFLDGQSGAFILNTVDWIMLDHGLLEMRSRGQQDPPINDELSKSTLALVEWGNKVGIPLMVLVLAFLNWRRRASVRRRVAREMNS